MNDARRAWEAHPKPTLRAVVQALAAQGLSCSVETLRRWHKATWIDRQLTPTPVDSSEYDELNQQDLNHLGKEAVRQSLIAQILLARHVARHAESIATEAPDKAAKIIEALKGPWASATIIIPPNDSRADDAKVVDGRVLHEKSATEIAIEEFQARWRETHVQEARQREARNRDGAGEKSPTDLAIEAFENRRRNGPA
jgi:hypothetical protein